MPENRLYQKLTFLNKQKGQPAPEGAVPLDADTLNALSQAIYDIETELIQAKEALAAIQGGSSSEVELIEGGEFAGILERIAATGRRMNGPDDEPLPPIDISKIGVTARELSGSPLPLDGEAATEVGIYYYDEDTNETVYMVDMIDELMDTMHNGDVMQALSDYFGNPEDPSEITVSQIWEFFDNYNEENDLGLRPAQLRLLGSFLWVQMQASRFEENDSGLPEYMEILEMIRVSRLSLSYGAQISTLGQIVFDKLIMNSDDNSTISYFQSNMLRLAVSGDKEALTKFMDAFGSNDDINYYVAALLVNQILNNNYAKGYTVYAVPKPIETSPITENIEFLNEYGDSIVVGTMYSTDIDGVANAQYRFMAGFHYIIEESFGNLRPISIAGDYAITPTARKNINSKSLRAYLWWISTPDYNESSTEEQLQTLKETLQSTYPTVAFGDTKGNNLPMCIGSADEAFTPTSTNNNGDPTTYYGMQFHVYKPAVEKIRDAVASQEYGHKKGALGIIIMPDYGADIQMFDTMSLISTTFAEIRYPIIWKTNKLYSW